MATSRYIVHTVGAGDTIQSIGALYGVDWTELVTVNGLEYPFIDDDIIDNEHELIDSVAKIGSKLVIPTPGLNIPIKTNNSADEVEKYAFGCDLDLYSLSETENHIINVETDRQLSDNGKGDVRLAEGINNLRQQLTTRLGTYKGTLLLHPEYGSKLMDYIGKRTTVEVLTEVSLEVQECLMEDFRVQGVSEVNCSFQEHGIYVSCIIIPIPPYSPFKLSDTFTE